MIGLFEAGVVESIGELLVGALPVLKGGAVETTGLGRRGDAVAFS